MGSWDGGSSDFAVARYNTNGGLDTTFSGDGRVNLSFGTGFGNAEFAQSVALQSDGKIVVAGYTNSPSTGANNDFGLARLNTDGSLDTTFDGDGKVTTSFGDDDRANSVVIQGDGKIIAAGSWDGGASDFALARYNSNGSLDSTSTPHRLNGAEKFGLHPDNLETFDSSTCHRANRRAKIFAMSIKFM